MPDRLNFYELCNEVLQYIKFRNENPVPNVMTILQGLGSPQEMLHIDEKWHTENFMWGNARNRRKRLLEQGNRREVEGDQVNGADAADQLL